MEITIRKENRVSIGAVVWSASHEEHWGECSDGCIAACHSVTGSWFIVCGGRSVSGLTREQAAQVVALWKEVKDPQFE